MSMYKASFYELANHDTIILLANHDTTILPTEHERVCCVVRGLRHKLY